MPTQTELRDMLQTYTQGVLAEHKKDFADYVATGATPEMSAEEVCGIMIGNSLNLCVQLSVQITMAILTDLKVVSVKPDSPKGGATSILDWKIIEGGLSGQSEK